MIHPNLKSNIHNVSKDIENSHLRLKEVGTKVLALTIIFGFVDKTGFVEWALPPISPLTALLISGRRNGILTNTDFCPTLS